jgi:hypothetical protein
MVWQNFTCGTPECVFHLTVKVLDPRTGELLREHRRQERGLHRIPEDAPAHMLPSTRRLLRGWSSHRHLCRHVYDRDSVVSIRRIQGI